MQNTRRKTAHTTKQGIQLSNLTRIRMVMAVAGFIGAVVFGFLMDKSLAPVRETSTASVDAYYGFGSLGNSLIIPGFLLSVGMCAYGVYHLFMLYRQLNDPNSYGRKSRRSSKQA